MESYDLPRAVICSPDIYPDSVKTLESMGIKVLFSCKNQNVMTPLMYHADMQIVKTGASSYVCAPECYDYYRNLLKDYSVTITCGNTYLSCNYPGDIAYNIIITEKLAVHNFNYTDSSVKNSLNDKNIIDVSQGYTSCTLCLLTDSDFITSDMGIYKSLRYNHCDVLLIDDTSVLLPGFDHGFIGGSTFMLSHDTLAVNGDILSHSDCKKIISFCNEKGIRLISLCDKSIMDIGSFVII